MADRTAKIPFEPSSYADWQQIATQELDGANPESKLTTNQYGFLIKPYYDSVHSKQLKEFELPASSSVFYGSRQWMNVPKIVVQDVREANHRALAYLNSGADGILFECISPSLDFNRLLASIKPEFCNLSFLSKEVEFDTPGFLSWIEKNQVHSIQGAVFQTNPNSLLTRITSTTFHPLGIYIHPGSQPVDEIAGALVKAVQMLEQISSNQFPRVAFSIPIHTHLFTDIAKLKALRLLWYQILGCYGVELMPVHIHAYSDAWVNPNYQPHGTMIKSTTAALAAILGGCDSLTVNAEDSGNEMMSRIARNVSSILREESYLNKVADPTAGSFFIDTLVNEIAEAAWKTFIQKIG